MTTHQLDQYAFELVNATLAVLVTMCAVAVVYAAYRLLKWAVTR